VNFCRPDRLPAYLNFTVVAGGAVGTDKTAFFQREELFHRHVAARQPRLDDKRDIGQGT
jgi:hypothetical protein